MRKINRLLRRLGPLVFMVSGVVDAAPHGPLVIVGGGGTPKPVLQEMVEMAGGNDAAIIVLPQASVSDGTASVEMFRSIGASNVRALMLDDHARVEAGIDEAKLIWFPGGQQGRLVASLRDADLIDRIRQRNAQGTVVGGTSAGAAAMSSLMIPRVPEKQSLAAGNTPIIEGLGLAPGLIVDQHFIARSRMNRLLSAVIDHPERVGVGIGERTAIVVTGGQLEVLGEGSVVVIDVRVASTRDDGPGTRQSARNIQLDVLRSGDTYRLDRVTED